MHHGMEQKGTLRKLAASLGSAAAVEPPASQGLSLCPGGSEAEGRAERRADAPASDLGHYSTGIINIMLN